MKVRIDKKAGFCPGVRKAIGIAEEKVAAGHSVAALGALIHNDREVNRLKNVGLQEINQDKFEESKIDVKQLKDQTLLIRAHGISPKLLDKIESNDIKYIDATCPLVARSHKIIKEYCKKGYDVVIVGKSYHPEVKGLLGFCERQGTVVYAPGDEKKVAINKKIVLIAQTTIEEERFDYFAKKLQKGVDELILKNTICPVVTRRQSQIVEFAKENDLIIFVAGRESSNSKVLFELCRGVNERSYLVSSFEEVKPEWFVDVETVGLTGGASTPIWQLEEFKQKLNF